MGVHLFHISKHLHISCSTGDNSQKLVSGTVCAPVPRKPLVKGERFVRYVTRAWPTTGLSPLLLLHVTLATSKLIHFSPYLSSLKAGFFFPLRLLSLFFFFFFSFSVEAVNWDCLSHANYFPDVPAVCSLTAFERMFPPMSEPP